MAELVLTLKQAEVKSQLSAAQGGARPGFIHSPYQWVARADGGEQNETAASEAPWGPLDAPNLASPATADGRAIGQPGQCHACYDNDFPHDPH